MTDSPKPTVQTRLAKKKEQEAIEADTAPTEMTSTNANPPPLAMEEEVEEPEALKGTNEELNKNFEDVTAFIYEEDIQKDTMSSITAKSMVETWMKQSMQDFKEDIMKDMANKIQQTQEAFKEDIMKDMANKIQQTQEAFFTKMDLFMQQQNQTTNMLLQQLESTSKNNMEEKLRKVTERALEVEQHVEEVKQTHEDINKIKTKIDKQYNRVTGSSATKDKGEIQTLKDEQVLIQQHVDKFQKQLDDQLEKYGTLQQLQQSAQFFQDETDKHKTDIKHYIERMDQFKEKHGSKLEELQEAIKCLQIFKQTDMKALTTILQNITSAETNAQTTISTLKQTLQILKSYDFNQIETLKNTIQTEREKLNKDRDNWATEIQEYQEGPDAMWEALHNALDNIQHFDKRMDNNIQQQVTKFTDIVTQKQEEINSLISSVKEDSDKNNNKTNMNDQEDQKTIETETDPSPPTKPGTQYEMHENDISKSTLFYGMLSKNGCPGLASTKEDYRRLGKEGFVVVSMFYNLDSAKEWVNKTERRYQQQSHDPQKTTNNTKEDTLKDQPHTPTRVSFQLHKDPKTPPHIEQTSDRVPWSPLSTSQQSTSTVSRTEKEDAYLCQYEGVEALSLDILKNLQFYNPKSTFEDIAPAHYALQRNWENNSPHGYSCGPKHDKLMNATSMPTLDAVDQVSVIKWFNKTGAMLANYNIAVMPFNHVELKYGAVGFCLPGVGKIKYLEMGRHLAMFLETKLPMGPDHPDNELAQALSLTAAKARPNGYEMLQTLFEHIIPAFNMDELTMKWPEYTESDNPFTFAESMIYAVRIARMRGQNTNDKTVVKSFLQNIIQHGHEKYNTAAFLRLDQVEQYTSEDILPEKFELRTIAHYISKTKHNTHYKESSSRKQIYNTYTTSPPTQHNSWKDIQHHSGLNEHIQGHSFQSYYINEVYRDNGKSCPVRVRVRL